MGDGGVSIPPWSVLRSGLGEIAMEGEKDEKNNGKNEGILRKTMGKQWKI